MMYTDIIMHMDRSQKVSITCVTWKLKAKRLQIIPENILNEGRIHTHIEVT